MTDAKLKSYVDRIERLEEERKAIGGDVRDIYTEAKSNRYNPKALRKIIAMRKQKADPVVDAEVEAYKAALGMAVEMVSNGEVSLRKAAKAAGVSKSSVHRALAVPAVSQSHTEAATLGVEPDARSEPSTPAEQSVIPRAVSGPVEASSLNGEGEQSGTHSVEQGDRQSPLRDGGAPVETSTVGPAVTTKPDLYQRLTGSFKPLSERGAPENVVATDPKPMPPPDDDLAIPAHLRRVRV